MTTGLVIASLRKKRALVYSTRLKTLPFADLRVFYLLHSMGNADHVVNTLVFFTVILVSQSEVIIAFSSFSFLNSLLKE